MILMYFHRDNPKNINSKCEGKKCEHQQGHLSGEKG